MASLNLPGISPAVERRVAAVDTETLRPVVRRVLDDETARVIEWQRRPIRGGAGGGHFGTALFRFEGRARTRWGPTDWAVVLKVLAERPGESPSGHPYWKREVRAYRSSLLADIPGGLVPARVYRVDEFPGEAVWLWLEHLTDAYGDDWPLDQYRRAARHLGQFNGTFVGRTADLDEPWLIERPFEFETTASVVALVDNVPGDPIVRRHFPTGEDRTRLFAAWRDRERFLAAREALPRTVCHFDAFGRNLFATSAADGTSRTVAIDWDQCGLARVGDDAGALVFLTLVFLDWPVQRAAELERAVLAGYRTGLADVGWMGRPVLAEQGYRLHLVVRWLEWLGSVRVCLDERLRGWVANLAGCSFEELLAGHRDLNRFVLDRVDDLDLAAVQPVATEPSATRDQRDR